MSKGSISKKKFRRLKKAIRNKEEEEEVFREKKLI
jgi:hypothetical protein